MDRLQKSAYVRLVCAIAVVLIFDTTALILVVWASQDEIAGIFQALGSLTAHIFSSYFPLWFATSGDGNHLYKLLERKHWVIVSCSLIACVAAATSLGLLFLSNIYYKFVVIPYFFHKFILI